MKNWLLMVAAFVVMIIVNVLGGTGHINGQSQQEISDRLTVLFTPAGYVFSIWSVIYVLLVIWLIIQYTRIGKRQQVKTSEVYLFISTCVLNVLWLLTWHYEIFIIAQLMMFGLLVALLVLYSEYPKGDVAFGGRLPFSMYAGWISVATIANMSYTLKHYDVSLGINEVAGTIGLLVIAVMICVATVYSRRDPIFGLVFVWAVIGIAAANNNETLVMSAYVCAAVIAIATIAVLFLKGKRKRNKYSFSK